MLKEFEYLTKVPDIPSSAKTKFLFILESPHTEEVEAKIPVVGNTGKRLLNWIIGKENNKMEYSFGEVACKCDTIAVMNVCQLPMQLDKKLNQVRKSYKYFRKHRTSKPEGNELNVLEYKIFKDFENRFKRIMENKSKNIKIIVCGRLAETYTKQCKDIDKTEIIYIPHPSPINKDFHKFSLEDSQKKIINEIKEEIEKTLNNDM